MKIINFEEAKARRQSNEKSVRHLSGASDGVLELQRQYQENVRFYERWYDEHVIGQNEEGGWVYRET